MNTKKLFKLGAAFAAFGVTTAAYAAPVPLDTFDTFVGAGAGQVGFEKTDAVTGGAGQTDGPDAVPISDTFFASMTRRVNINNTTGGAGNATIQNGQAVGVYSFPGQVAYSNATGVLSTATFTYTLLNPVDLTTLWDRFAFLFTATDFPGTLKVDVTDLAAQTATITTGVGGLIVAPTSVGLLFSSATGTAAALNAAKTIKFTLTPNNDAADWRFDAAVLDNPTIPEASTAIPALAFAGVVGYFGWRRSRAKAA